MKKILLITISILFFYGCESREEKVNKLIRQEMFETLYDFDSYEPIETKLDSAFKSIYTDSAIITYAYIAKEFVDETNKYTEKAKDAQSIMDIWGSSYYLSTYAQNKYNEAQKQFEENLEKAKNCLEVTNKYYDSIRISAKDFKQDFWGWKVIHRFRCKTKGGDPNIGRYLYIFDKDVKEILYRENLDDEEIERLHNMINEALNEDESKSASTL